MNAAAGMCRVALATNVERVTGQREVRLGGDWQLLSSEPEAGAVRPPGDSAAWKSLPAPGPVAAVDPDQDPATLDRRDHWFRCRFRAPDAGVQRVLLCLDGLATLTEGWLNGAPLLRSDNMFLAHRLDVSDVLRADNELLLRFRALAPALRAMRGRGRWPTRLVSDRHLRSVRTTLLGYTPGFCPEVKAVGPWRPVWLALQQRVSVERASVEPRLEGETARLRVGLELRLLGGEPITSARLLLAQETVDLDVAPLADDRVAVAGELIAQGIAPWWPHTHGEPALHAARVELAMGERTVSVDLGRVGFRRLELVDGDLDRFHLRINGVEIFCRGANWTPLDLRRLHVDAPTYRAQLWDVRAAGMNMVRVGGTSTYESDAFYRLCDELGILVWQDLMFANMDYPSDEAFRASACLEAEQLLERTTQRCCMTVLCGSSELQQQAAMMGRERDDWAHPLFDRELPTLRDRMRPELIYVPSTPCRGALPMHVSAGPSHYYGVGAYLRPPSDATLAGVRFATECLAFANVPEQDPTDRTGVPRDRGASWDFADVTEHYLALGFGVDPVALDRSRHAALARVTTGEVMASVLGQWRRRESTCGGALVWWLRDLTPGSGWGVIDHAGQPKAAYYYLSRTCQPTALWLVDRGLDGLQLHLDHEGATAAAGELLVELFHDSGRVSGRARRQIEVGPRGQSSWNVEGLLGHFADPTYSYRFGPPETQVVLARFLPDDGGAPLCAFHLPGGWAQPMVDDVGLSAEMTPVHDGRYRVTVVSERFAQAVAVRVDGFVPSDNYFHLAPNVAHSFELVPRAAAGAPRGTLAPLNALQAAELALPRS